MEYVAEQLGIADLSVAKQYLRRPQTRLEHRWEIAEVDGWRDFAEVRDELYQAYHEGMEDQLGALGLVINCITLWNTVYLDRILQQLREEGVRGA